MIALINSFTPMFYLFFQSKTKNAIFKALFNFRFFKICKAREVISFNYLLIKSLNSEMFENGLRTFKDI